MRVEGDDGIKLFDSISAAYLSIGPGAGVLKSWKKSGSPALSHTLTEGMARALGSYENLVLIPVPQSPARKWQLNGGSVLRLCEMIVRSRRQSSAKTEIQDLLEVDVSSETNQARMKGDGRYKREQSFKFRPSKSFTHEPLGEKTTLLLVDDFLTSGSTLRGALETLRNGFEDSGLFSGRKTRVGIFVLGFRPSLGVKL